jgi:hypothetical protein
MLRPLIMIGMLACAGSSNEDSSASSDSSEVETDEPYSFECDEADLEIDPLGPSSPTVGDEWTVWLRCDGTTLTGTMVLQVDPPEFATIDTNVVTFLVAGTAEMTVQVGAYRASMDVTVTE